MITNPCFHCGKPSTEDVVLCLMPRRLGNPGPTRRISLPYCGKSRDCLNAINAEIQKKAPEFFGPFQEPTALQDNSNC